LQIAILACTAINAMAEQSTQELILAPSSSVRGVRDALVALSRSISVSHRLQCAEVSHQHARTLTPIQVVCWKLR